MSRLTEPLSKKNLSCIFGIFEEMSLALNAVIVFNYCRWYFVVTCNLHVVWIPVMFSTVYKYN